MQNNREAINQIKISVETRTGQAYIEAKVVWFTEGGRIAVIVFVVVCLNGLFIPTGSKCFPCSL